jgi:hypothetical protein
MDLSAPATNIQLGLLLYATVVMTALKLSARRGSERRNPLIRVPIGRMANSRTESEQHLEPAGRAFHPSSKLPGPEPRMGVHSRWPCLYFSYPGY